MCVRVLLDRPAAAPRNQRRLVRTPAGRLLLVYGCRYRRLVVVVVAAVIAAATVVVADAVVRRQHVV